MKPRILAAASTPNAEGHVRNTRVLFSSAKSRGSTPRRILRHAFGLRGHPCGPCRTQTKHKSRCSKPMGWLWERFRRPCSHRGFCSRPAHDVLACARCVLLRPLIPTLVFVAVDQSDVWLFPAHLLPVGQSTPDALENHHLRIDFVCFTRIHLVHHETWRPRVRSNADRHRRHHGCLVGGVARPHDGLGRILLSQSIVDVDSIACGSHEDVWIDRVDEQ